MTVCLNHITKRFADTEAIRDLSITFPEDAIVAIMGPSGCGKTTILKLLAGLLSPDEGELVCDASQISYVFQEPAKSRRCQFSSCCTEKKRTFSPPTVRYTRSRQNSYRP